MIVYGVGGLASYAIQFLRHLAPYVKIIAVSRSDNKLKWAVELGAHYAVHPSEVNKIIKDLSPDGASVMLDFVGNEESAKMIPLLEPSGAVVLVGMEVSHTQYPCLRPRSGNTWSLVATMAL